MSVHDETPAETIRRAIEQMRAEAETVAAKVATWGTDHIAATADLLEAIAVGYELTLAMFPAGSNAARTVATAYGFEDALRLARTYLGETL